MTKWIWNWFGIKLKRIWERWCEKIWFKPISAINELIAELTWMKPPKCKRKLLLPIDPYTCKIFLFPIWLTVYNVNNISKCICFVLREQTDGIIAPLEKNSIHEYEYEAGNVAYDNPSFIFLVYTTKVHVFSVRLLKFSFS